MWKAWSGLLGEALNAMALGVRYGVEQPEIRSSRSADQFLMVDLTMAPLDVGQLYEALLRADCGAVVVFSGTVRDFSGDREGVIQLTYEAYEEPARRRLTAIGEQIFQRYGGVRAVAIVHRLGQMAPTESTVVVGVASHHRDHAFEAARFGIDALKSSVPIWKHELWEGGAEWGLNSQAVVDVDVSADS
jgi:molybdopterin synthase catalytic subunit